MTRRVFRHHICAMAGVAVQNWPMVIDLTSDNDNEEPSSFIIDLTADSEDEQ